MFNNSLSIGDLTTSVIALFALILSIIILLIGIRNNKIAKTMFCLTDLFASYKETMGNLNDALEESDELRKFLKECEKNGYSNFNDVYFSKEYKYFRDVHYFFELLGSLIKQKEIDIKTVWNFFTFPIDYFLKTKDIRQIITEKKCLPTYGENFNYLFLFFHYTRNIMGKDWEVNGETSNYSDAEIDGILHEFNYLKKEFRWKIKLLERRNK